MPSDPVVTNAGERTRGFFFTCCVASATRMLECLPRTENLSPVITLSLHNGCSGHTFVGMSADCSLYSTTAYAMSGTLRADACSTHHYRSRSSSAGDQG